MVVLEADYCNSPGPVSLMAECFEEARDTVTLAQVLGEFLHFLAKLSVDVLLLGCDGFLQQLYFYLKFFQFTDVILERCFR